MTLTLAEGMLYTTVKISGFKGSVPAGTGTGFFWSIGNGEKIVILLATNKHVVMNCDRLEVTCHVLSKLVPNSSSGTFIPVSLTIGQGPEGVLMHPDPNVDLCAINFSEAMKQADKAGT